MHALRPDDRYGGRAFEERDECPGSGGVPALRRDRGRKHDILPELLREGTDDIQAWRGQDIRQEVAEYRFALGNGRDDLRWIGLGLHLGVHRFGNAKPMKDTSNRITRRTFRNGCNRLCLEQRCLERFDRRDVGSLRLTIIDLPLRKRCLLYLRPPPQVPSTANIEMGEQLSWRRGSRRLNPVRRVVRSPVNGVGGYSTKRIVKSSRLAPSRRVPQRSKVTDFLPNVLDATRCPL